MRTSIYKKNSEGFTLIEITVAIFAFSLIAVGMIALVSSMLRGASIQTGLLSDADQARRVAFTFVSEVRKAVTSANGSYSLEQAGDQQFIFYANIDSDALIERVRYYVQNGKLYKGVIKPSGSPAVYNGSAEVSTLVLSNLANGANPVFYYYDDTYAGVSNSYLIQPVSVTAVKFVKIQLQSYNRGGVTNTNKYNIVAGAAVRNLKTNLGN